MKTSFSSACNKVSIRWDRGFQTHVGEWAALEVVLSPLYVKLFNSEWNLSPCAGIRIQTKPSLGIEPMIFQLESLRWCLDLLRLRSFASHHRKNSVREKVIGKKWILFREKHSLQTECRPRQRASVGASKCGVFSFYGLGHFIG